MNENERKDVSLLTDDELRAEIAVATGAIRSYEFEGKMLWRVNVGGFNLYGHTLVEALNRAGVQNWPEKSGIAFELVRKVAPRDNARILIDLEYSEPDDPELEVSYVETWYADEIRYSAYEPLYEASANTLARALSELALLALRGQAVSDE